MERLESLRSQAYLLISYHNYGGTPPLDSVLRRMARIPADGYKIVTTARKPSDNYRVLALARAHPKMPMVLLAMGETGFPDARAFDRRSADCTPTPRRTPPKEPPRAR